MIPAESYMPFHLFLVTVHHGQSGASKGGIYSGPPTRSPIPVAKAARPTIVPRDLPKTPAAADRGPEPLLGVLASVVIFAIGSALYAASSRLGVQPTAVLPASDDDEEEDEEDDQEDDELETV